MGAEEDVNGEGEGGGGCGGGGGGAQAVEGVRGRGAGRADSFNHTSGPRQFTSFCHQLCQESRTGAELARRPPGGAGGLEPKCVQRKAVRGRTRARPAPTAGCARGAGWPCMRPTHSTNPDRTAAQRRRRQVTQSARRRSGGPRRGEGAAPGDSRPGSGGVMPAG